MANKKMFQIGDLSAFAAGDFGGIVPAEEFLKYGNTGIGTFEGGDGEMLIYDGKMYRAGDDFAVTMAKSKELIPFANVADFHPEIKVDKITNCDREELEKTLATSINKFGLENIYLLKLEGTFASVKVRSEKGQQPPYEPLEVFLSHAQVEKAFENVAGMLIALYFPDKYSKVNAAGWHYHFVTADMHYGGHVLDCEIQEAEGCMDTYEQLIHVERENYR